MSKFAKIIHKNKENFLIKKFTALFKRKIKGKRKGRFSFVLTGGESPIKLYRYLAKDKSIPWKNVDFFIGDERCVSENSKSSNINMCKKNLLNKIPISNNQIHKFSINKKNPNKIARDYEKKIKKLWTLLKEKISLGSL